MNTFWYIVPQHHTAMQMPLAVEPGTVPDPLEEVLLMKHLETSLVTAMEIRKATARDPVLARVLQNVQIGRMHVGMVSSNPTGMPALG